VVQRGHDPHLGRRDLEHLVVPLDLVDVHLPELELQQIVHLAKCLEGAAVDRVDAIAHLESRRLGGVVGLDDDVGIAGNAVDPAPVRSREPLRRVEHVGALEGDRHEAQQPEGSPGEQLA
jgi:hypothetical protein